MVFYDKEIGQMNRPDPLPENIDQMTAREQAEKRQAFVSATEIAAVERSDAEERYLREIIMEDIQDLRSQCSRVSRDIQRAELEAIEIKEKQKAFSTKNMKEADNLIIWHLQARTKFEETKLVITGAFKAMINDYLKEAHATILKTQMNERNVTHGVIDAYDNGDLYHMLINLEVHYSLMAVAVEDNGPLIPTIIAAVSSDDITPEVKFIGPASGNVTAKKIEESATLRSGMYENNVYLGEVHQQDAASVNSVPDIVDPVGAPPLVQDDIIDTGMTSIKCSFAVAPPDQPPNVPDDELLQM
jgi:hypothetical protein